MADINDGKTIRIRDGVILVTDEDGFTEEVDPKGAIMLANAGYKWVDDAKDGEAKRLALASMSNKVKAQAPVHVDSGKGVDLGYEGQTTDWDEGGKMDRLKSGNFAMDTSVLPVKIHEAKLDVTPVANYEDDEARKAKAVDGAKFGGIKNALTRK